MFNKHQYNILSERYFETLLGSIYTLIIMLGQAPLIAFCVILKFGSTQATETLYFIMALSCLWFGCINSCMEIAKEKNILKREKLFGLDLKAYLLSKIKVLSIVGLIEVFLYIFLLDKNIDTNLNIIFSFVALFLLYMAGMSLGLFLSEWMRNTTYAVISVPIVLIPQIVFSKFTLSENLSQGVVKKIESLMFVKWGLIALNNSKSNEFIFNNYMQAIGVIFLLIVFFIFLTYIHLILTDD